MGVFFRFRIGFAFWFGVVITAGASPAVAQFDLHEYLRTDIAEIQSIHTKDYPRPEELMVSPDYPNPKERDQFMVNAIDFRYAIRPRFSGEVRKITGKRREFIERWMKMVEHRQGYDGMYQQEILVTSGGQSVWIPMQESLVPFIHEELLPGDKMDINLIVAGKLNDQWMFMATGFTSKPGPLPRPPDKPLIPGEETLFVMADFQGQSEWLVTAAIKYHRGDYREALDQMIPYAEDGNAMAQWFVGCAFLLGKGVQVDSDEGLAWIRKSVEQDYAPALVTLAISYQDNNLNVPAQPRQAFDLIKQAADMDDPSALWQLGMYYVRGNPVKQSSETAAELFARSAHDDYGPALVSLGVMLAAGDGIEQDFDQAIELYERGATMGFGRAARNLGTTFNTGSFERYDPYSATVWYNIAVLLGDEGAQSALQPLEQATYRSVAERARLAARLWLRERGHGGQD